MYWTVHVAILIFNTPYNYISVHEYTGSIFQAPTLEQVVQVFCGWIKKLGSPIHVLAPSSAGVASLLWLCRVQARDRHWLERRGWVAKAVSRHGRPLVAFSQPRIDYKEKWSSIVDESISMNKWHSRISFILSVTYAWALTEPLAISYKCKLKT